ncbi:MAG: B12-binding domain-containing radical SAM protein [Ancalomicrobiaceae bacterium]|nr:B12-binding domain-containing radical SAM protein [Ancalomicrobiaceae bacterium]
MNAPAGRRIFHLYLIKPSHYDDDGYVIQWFKAAIPSNSLAVMYGLARDCDNRRVLGDDVELKIVAIDETNARVRADKIAAEFKKHPFGLVGLVGVQSNQFPRAVDIARPLREAGVPVMIGGFHVSGCRSMLPELPPDIQAAADMGISFFYGEAEGRFDRVLQDAANGALKPSYDYMNDLPGINETPMPFLPADVISRTVGAVTSFDAGRGCPFQCSFCTIINVQGRKSRFRSVDDIEAIVRANLKQGVRRFFITDDNLARNKNWEAIFDRLAQIRRDEKFSLIIQVDTLCHRIPGFIEKAAKAGVRRVYIGLENINPDNLLAAKKKQNRIAEYRQMLLDWKHVGCTIYAGYIIGFPHDTLESTLRDIEIIKRELPLDLLEFFFLTPLPGSEDHQKLYNAGVPMDPDMNKYDLEHLTTAHSKMSREDWERAYKLAWETYYSWDHMETVMRRAGACGISPGNMMFLLAWFALCIKLEKVHPLQGGYLRRKVRNDRRPGMPIEHPLVFYPKYVADLVWKHVGLAKYLWRMVKVRNSIKRDPNRRAYMDTALTPVSEDELETLEMFTSTDSTRHAADHARKLHATAANVVTAAE